MASSKVETYKLNSNYLTQNVQPELVRTDTGGVNEEAYQLLKFSGIYQQDDRDLRKERRKEGKERAFSFMLRGKSPGGALTAEQYLVYDDLADEVGNGTLRFTTRQGIQLHGVFKGDLKKTVNQIYDRLLTSLAGCGDVNRNVMACPAPETTRRHALVQEVAAEIERHLLPRSSGYFDLWIDGERQKDVPKPPQEVYTQAIDDVEPIYGKTYLPRKFKIGVAFPEDNCVDVFTQDIGIVPVLANDETLHGFNVLVGGGLGMSHTNPETFPRLASELGFVTCDQLFPVVEAIVTIQRDYGDRENRKLSRMKYLVERLGIEAFREEVETRVGFEVQPWVPVGEFKVDDHLGWREQGDGGFYFGLPIENGRVHDDQTARLRTAIRTILQALNCDIRITPHHNLLFINLRAEDKAFILKTLQDHHVKTLREISNARRSAMACPALPTCTLAIAESERVLPALVDDIEKELSALGLASEPISIRMTGCPNGCARPYTAEIAFVGQSLNMYKVFLGGTFEGTALAVEYAEKVHLNELVPMVKPLLRTWKERRLPHEAFGDFVRRVGVDTLREQVLVPA